MKSHYERGCGKACNDHLGQGRFCNALWEDKDGFYCSIAVADGYPGHCGFTEGSCHLVSYEADGERFHKIQCGGDETGEPGGDGVCQDFEPAKWLRVKFGLE